MWNIPAFGLVACAAVLGAAPNAWAATETVVHNFGAPPTVAIPADGRNPYAGLLEDKKGNFWGATFYGGAYGYGAVFEITKKGVYSVVYSFGAKVNDGMYPFGNLVEYETGNIWGVTAGGGQYGQGSVFEITSSGEIVVYSFGAKANDGNQPVGLVEDKTGDYFWGVTQYGGASNICSGSIFTGSTANGCGTLFKITPAGAETVVYSFGANPTDGQTPYSSVIEDKKGNLWGTTYYGGANGLGTAFEITSAGIESVVYSFGANATDGQNPVGGLIEDKKGNFWGTTANGGANTTCYDGTFTVGPGCGTVFELTNEVTKKAVKTVEKVVYSFGATVTDGWRPYDTLVEDKSGNFWGTTYYGGANKTCPFYSDFVGCGTVFEITPKGEAVVYSFGSSSADAATPFSGLIEDKAGNFWGATVYGGANAAGAVFEIAP